MLGDTRYLKKKKHEHKKKTFTVNCIHIFLKTIIQHQVSLILNDCGYLPLFVNSNEAHLKLLRFCKMRIATYGYHVALKQNLR